METSTPDPLFVLLFIAIATGGCSAWRSWIDDSRVAVPVICAAAVAALDAAPSQPDADAPPPPPEPDPAVPSPTLPLPPPKAQARK